MLIFSNRSQRSGVGVDVAVLVLVGVVVLVGISVLVPVGILVFVGTLLGVIVSASIVRTDSVAVAVSGFGIGTGVSGLGQKIRAATIVTTAAVPPTKNMGRRSFGDIFGTDG